MPEQVHVSGPMYRPSHDDYQGVDAGTKRILYLMGAGGLAILLGFGAYRVLGHSGGGVVPVIQAEQGPLRIKPENPGGMTVTEQTKRADPNDSHLAPATEEPNPTALLAVGGPSRAPRPPVAMLAPTRPKPVTVLLSTAKSETDAQGDWDKLAKKLPDLFRDHRALFQKTDEHGPTPWRLRTGGFADAAQAKAFCDKVKAKGGQCTVIDS
jgi:hypothetical protein